MTFDELAKTKPLPLAGRDTVAGRLWNIAVSADRKGFVTARDGWLTAFVEWLKEVQGN